MTTRSIARWAFFNASERECDRVIDERRAERRRQWRRLQWVAAMLATLLVVTGVTAYLATRESRRARAESARAERNLQLARQAVDESLATVQREPALLGVDVPEIVGFRRELLEKAQRFYTEFIAQAPASEELQRENAIAKLRLGHIDRALDARAAAVDDYRAAIDSVQRAGLGPSRSRRVSVGTRRRPQLARTGLVAARQPFHRSQGRV